MAVLIQNKRRVPLPSAPDAEQTTAADACNPLAGVCHVRDQQRFQWQQRQQPQCGVRHYMCSRAADNNVAPVLFSAVCSGRLAWRTRPCAPAEDGRQHLEERLAFCATKLLSPRAQ